MTPTKSAPMKLKDFCKYVYYLHKYPVRQSVWLLPASRVKLVLPFVTRTRHTVRSMPWPASAHPTPPQSPPAPSPGRTGTERKRGFPGSGPVLTARHLVPPHAAFCTELMRSVHHNRTIGATTNTHFIHFTFFRREG